MASKWKSLLNQIKEFVKQNTEKQTNQLLEALDTTIEIITAEDEWNTVAGEVSKEDIEDLKQKILTTYDDVEIAIQKTIGVHGRVVRAEENIIEAVRDKGDKVVEEINGGLDRQFQDIVDVVHEETQTVQESVQTINNERNEVNTEKTAVEPQQTQPTSNENVQSRTESVQNSELIQENDSKKGILSSIGTVFKGIWAGVTGLWNSAKSFYSNVEKHFKSKSTMWTLILMGVATLYAAVKSTIDWLKKEDHFESLKDYILKALTSLGNAVLRETGKLIKEGVGFLVKIATDEKTHEWFSNTFFGKLAQVIEWPIMKILQPFVELIRKLFPKVDLSGWDAIMDRNNTTMFGQSYLNYKKAKEKDKEKKEVEKSLNRIGGAGTEINREALEQSISRWQNAGEDPKIWTPEGKAAIERESKGDDSLIPGVSNVHNNFPVQSQQPQGGPTVINQSSVHVVNKNIHVDSNGTYNDYYNVGNH